MATGRERFVGQLYKALDRIHIMPDDEAKRFIRRCVIQLRNIRIEMARFANFEDHDQTQEKPASLSAGGRCLRVTEQVRRT